MEHEYGVMFWPYKNLSARRGPVHVRKVSQMEAVRYLFRPYARRLQHDDVYLRNGARLYRDGSHPEYATPECLSPPELVAHVRAGDRVLERLAAQAEATLREEGIDGTLHVLKNNTDSSGKTYGCHENYLMSREARVADFHAMTQSFFRSSSPARSLPVPARCCRRLGGRCTPSASGPSTCTKSCR